MSKEIITLKYSQALSGYAYEKELLDKIKQDFQKTKELIWDNKEARLYFLFPQIEKEEKKQLLTELKTHLELDKGFFRFLNLLIEENRFSIFSGIYENFLSDYQSYKEKLFVKISSAFSLSDSEEKNIAQTLKTMFKKELVIEKKVDNNLLGGVEIFLVNEDLKINLSVKGKLDDLKEELLQ